MFGKSKKIENKIKTGDKFLRDNKLVEAEAAYREALLLDDQNAETLYSLGCVANKRNDFASADVWARKAISADPSHRLAHFLLANAQFGTERFEEALQTLLSANTNENDEPMAMVGLIYEKLGKSEKAEETFRGDTLLALRPLVSGNSETWRAPDCTTKSFEMRKYTSPMRAPLSHAKI